VPEVGPGTAATPVVVVVAAVVAVVEDAVEVVVVLDEPPQAANPVPRPTRAAAVKRPAQGRLTGTPER